MCAQSNVSGWSARRTKEEQDEPDLDARLHLVLGLDEGVKQLGRVNDGLAVEREQADDCRVPLRTQKERVRSSLGAREAGPAKERTLLMTLANGDEPDDIRIWRIRLLNACAARSKYAEEKAEERQPGQVGEPGERGSAP